jgi:hypothetical protein
MLTLLSSVSIPRAAFVEIHISCNRIEPRSLAQICSAKERKRPCPHSLKALGSTRDESGYGVEPMSLLLLYTPHSRCNCHSA